MKQSPQNNRQLLGNEGEDIAAKFLSQLGYSIVERNFRIRYGEIDIVAVDGDSLVFVEVKTRRNRNFGYPEEAVTQRKIRDIIRTSEVYTAKHPEYTRLQRIDVIAVEKDINGKVTRIEHIKNVSI